jgi:hypothetical protein
MIPLRRLSPPPQCIPSSSCAVCCPESLTLELRLNLSGKGTIRLTGIENLHR